VKVLALVPNQVGFSPGQRASIELWEKVLGPAGIELTFEPFETERLHSILLRKGNSAKKAVEMFRGFAGRISALGKLDDFDAVFVYREAALMGPAILERAIARKKPIIYELDDPLYMPYKSPSNGYLSYLKFFGKIKEIIRISKVVIANSSHIRDYALQFNKNVFQIPSLVDTSEFTYVPFPESPERVCVGWSGSPTTLKNLKLVEPPLRQISDEQICDIHFIGGDPELDGVKYTWQTWKRETEAEDLRKMQIGLVPLPDFAWNKHKFIMKTAQYMALGIVPIGTPMASNPEVIRRGDNGFLADSDEEWADAIRMLVSDSALRNDMSRKAAADAREKYSLEANKEKIISAFHAAVS
jgi:glycosyltransferase involved in cell wall biosynthesis